MRYSPFLKSVFETAIVFAVGAAVGKEVAGTFYTNYYWLFSFGFVAAGLETIRLAGAEKKASSFALIAALCLLFAMIAGIFQVGETSDLLLVLGGALLATLNNIIYVQLEAQRAYARLLLLSVLPRAIALVAALMLLVSEFDGTVRHIAWIYFLKESCELTLHLRRPLEFLKDQFIWLRKRRWVWGKGYYMDLAFVSASIGYDPVLRFFIAATYGPAAAFLYEYLTRIPRLLSSSWMQITRHTLFANAGPHRYSGNYSTTLLMVVLINAVALAAVWASPSADDVTTLAATSVAASLNMYLSVAGYNAALRAGQIRLLLTLYVTSLINTVLIIQVFPSSAKGLLYAVLYQSAHTFAFLHSTLKGK